MTNFIDSLHKPKPNGYNAQTKKREIRTTSTQNAILLVLLALATGCAAQPAELPNDPYIGGRVNAALTIQQRQDQLAQRASLIFQLTMLENAMREDFWQAIHWNGSPNCLTRHRPDPRQPYTSELDQRIGSCYEQAIAGTVTPTTPDPDRIKQKLDWKWQALNPANHVRITAVLSRAVDPANPNRPEDHRDFRQLHQAYQERCQPEPGIADELIRATDPWRHWQQLDTDLRTCINNLHEVMFPLEHNPQQGDDRP